MNELLSTLNEEQLKPVLDTEGAVLVLAGAGSGKTRVLTTRIAYLVEEKRVLPGSILSITFTNKAANEMKERLSHMTDTNGMWVCTIHSMCVKILRMYPEKRNVTKDFSIYSEQERTAVIKQAFKECDYDEEALFKSAKFHISNAKMLGLSPDRYLEENKGERNIEDIIKIYRRYEKHLKENNALDFDDLLTEARSLLLEDKEAREYLAGKFRYIHVDEFQDTNAVQFDIIKALASVHGNLFVVGDDDQSIYGWRGAEIENILHFERSYPNAKTYKLQRNYRSTKAILALANASIAHNIYRKSKQLWTEANEGEKPVYHEAGDETEEAAYCARLIAEKRRGGYKLNDFAVLMRINALTRSYEQEFTKYGISYKVFGGFKFFERKEIKDILAYLRLVANPFDSEALARIINVPRRGIGEKTIETLRAYAAEEEISLFDAVLDAGDLNFTSGTKAKLKEFASYVKSLVVLSQTVSVSELTDRLITTSGMKEQYEGNSDENVSKRANIDEFQNSVEEFARQNEGATLSDYLQQITLYSDTDEMDDGDYVTIATIHAVKGLEFRCVFITGLEEGIMPTPRAKTPREIEEERRLMYVAITRAKEELWLTASKSRYLYGKREATARSQFVGELDSCLKLPSARDRYSGDYYEEYGSYGGGRSASRGSYGGYGSYGGSRQSGYGGGSYGNGYGGYGSGYASRQSGYGGGGSYGNGYGGYGSGYASRQNGRAYGSEGRSSAERDEGYRTFGAQSEKRPPKLGGIPVRAAAEQKPKKDVSAFVVGAHVRHAKFGEGVVVSVRGKTDSPIITVRFLEAGNKDLAAALAPLEILE